MTAYAWPGWGVSAFELRIQPNTRQFVGPYTPNVQTLDFLGERWIAKMTIVPTVDSIVGAAYEAFWDRLKGPANQITLGHLKLSAPQGTMRGTPTLNASVAQLANTATLNATAGATLRAGDMLGIGGQLVRIMADATADGSGHMTIEFQPRARVAWSAGAAVTWAAPTAPFMIKADSGPTTWEPGFANGTTVELIEVL
jgi:hypothetical protein